MQVLCYCLHMAEIPDKDGVQKVCSLTYRIIFPILISFAVFSNIVNVVVLSYLHHVSNPNPAKVYLLWLAITHCLTCIPILVGLIKGIKGWLPFSWAFYSSHLETPLYNALNFACVYIIVGLSMDRYLAVCKAYKYTQSSGFRKAYLITSIAYGAAFIFYAPFCFYQKPHLRANSSDEWYIGEGWLLHKPLWIVWANVVQVAHRIVPGIILLILNFQIFITVAKLQKVRKYGSSNKNGIRHQKDRQLLHLLLALTLIFFITNIPSAVLKMKYLMKPGYCNLSYAEEVSRAISNCLEMCGYCFDFIFYFLMNNEYKQGLLTLIHFLWQAMPWSKKQQHKKVNFPDHEVEIE